MGDFIRFSLLRRAVKISQSFQAIGRIPCSGNTLRSSPAAPTQSLCPGSGVKLQDSFLHQMIRIYSTIHPIHPSSYGSISRDARSWKKKSSAWTIFRNFQSIFRQSARCSKMPFHCLSSLVPRYVPKEVGALSGTGASPAGMLSRGRNRGIWRAFLDSNFDSESLLVQLLGSFWFKRWNGFADLSYHSLLPMDKILGLWTSCDQPAL